MEITICRQRNKTNTVPILDKDDFVVGYCDMKTARHLLAGKQGGLAVRLRDGIILIEQPFSEENGEFIAQLRV